MPADISATTTRVLIVEDNPADVNILRLAFAETNDWPVETLVAEDGERAIRLLQQLAANPSARPDLILLDLNIPRYDGAEVLSVIRSTAALANLPVAILSSSPCDVIQRKLTIAGVTADGHFTKPLDFDEFLRLGRVLRDWYERQRERR